MNVEERIRQVHEIIEARRIMRGLLEETSVTMITEFMQELDTACWRKIEELVNER